MRNNSEHQPFKIAIFSSAIVWCLLEIPVRNICSVPEEYFSFAHKETNALLNEMPKIKKELFMVAMQRLLIGLTRNSIKIPQIAKKPSEWIIKSATTIFVGRLNNRQIARFLPSLLDKELMTNGDYPQGLPKFEPIELKIRKKHESEPVIRGFYAPYIYSISGGHFTPN